MMTTIEHIRAKARQDPERLNEAGQAPDVGKHPWFGSSQMAFERLPGHRKDRVIELVNGLERFSEDEIVTDEEAMIIAVKLESNEHDGGKP